MEAIVERCCGLDVHQAVVVACVLVGPTDQRATHQVQRFGTTTAELLKLRDWLKEHRISHVGMESTGVYWKPVYAVLEGDFELIVGNAQHIKNVPGRKTDMNDARWLAQLVRCGLIRKSYVPDAHQRVLRDLVRYRDALVRGGSSERNRTLKLLETVGIKLATFASNVFGASGMAMLRALAAGNTSAAQMAELARGVLRKKMPSLEEALKAPLCDAHRQLLSIQLGLLEQHEQNVARVQALIDEQMAPYAQEQARLMQLPGVDKVTSASIIAEMGVDMTVFASAEACAAWAGVCPGSHESAGKRSPTGRRRGNINLVTTLVRAAQAAVKKKGSYFKDKFHRLKTRRGHGRAIMAIGHKLLVAAYHMLKDGTDYRELGEQYLDKLKEQQTVRLLEQRLKKLGYDVVLTLRPQAPAVAAAEA
jgi:transposase